MLYFEIDGLIKAFKKVNQFSYKKKNKGPVRDKPGILFGMLKPRFYALVDATRRALDTMNATGFVILLSSSLGVHAVGVPVAQWTLGHNTIGGDANVHTEPGACPLMTEFTSL